MTPENAAKTIFNTLCEMDVIKRDEVTSEQITAILRVIFNGCTPEEIPALSRAAS